MKDGQDAGNVDAIEGDIVVITSEGDRKEDNLPKSQVGGYDGAEVSLKITFGELEHTKWNLNFQAFLFFALFIK